MATTKTRLEDHVFGLVLASGLSTRFGSENKLLADLGGEPVLSQTLHAYTVALPRCYVVIPDSDPDLAKAVKNLKVNIVMNPDNRLGQSTSLRAGIASLPEDALAIVIGVGDQPFLQPHTIRRLIEVWRTSEVPTVAPLYKGKRGNPVLFDGSLLSELSQVTGDIGGRDVLRRHPGATVDESNLWAGFDINTVEDLATARRARGLRARMGAPADEGW